MASARTDDRASTVVSSLDRRRSRCAPGGHASLRAFAAAHAPPMLRVPVPTFGAPSALGAGACDGDDDDDGDDEDDRQQQPQQQQQLRACDEQRDAERERRELWVGGAAVSAVAADDGTKTIAARAVTTLTAMTAQHPTYESVAEPAEPVTNLERAAAAGPWNEARRPRDALALAPHNVMSDSFCRLSGYTGAELQSFASMQPAWLSSSAPLTAGASLLSLPRQASADYFPPPPNALAPCPPSSHPHPLVFGPNVPHEESGAPQQTTATPKRPREIPNIDDITSLLSKCRANDRPDDVQRATELFASLRVPGKRPRTREKSPELASASLTSEHGPATTDAGSAQELGGNVSGDDDDHELSFLVTHCDIDADSRCAQFMPYIT